MVRDQSFREIERAIERALRSGASGLNLSRSRLTALPESLRQLKKLKTLDLIENRLESLPKWIGELSQLEEIYLNQNRLTALPDSFGRLKNLKKLGLSRNQLRILPEALGYLSQLEWLDLDHNQLSSVPESLQHLSLLNVLYLHHNNLTSLPSVFAHTDISFQLNGNPLNPELAAAYAKGPGAVRTYLRELAKGAQQRYEAKLLILGDGNEGKTCVSRALRGLPFEHQSTTRGVDVEQWHFPHPDNPARKDQEITLNIWDFEGQEINHQTHQFFLTADALYLLVFKCRDLFLMDRAEYWLDTIRARAPKAKVAIVITECEARTPFIREDKLLSEYGDILIKDNWLFSVGCADKSGIPELQGSVMRWAAKLPFMGREWPTSYSRAEMAIQERTEAGMSHIDRTQLNELFGNAGIDNESFADVASSMASLGVITQFADCPDLSDFIVLQPQWLTKAISEIMEDKQIAREKGKISLQRMQEIWNDSGYDGLFAPFHNCMKEFELCYDLDHPFRSCLVPLRFGYLKPEIPWTAGVKLKRRRVSYKLNIRPPIGLLSRFIVKTHHMIVSTEEFRSGVYWHNGVFLRTGEGPLASEALCEFDTDERTLTIEVRAAFPQNMIEQIHAYVKAVFSFFTGLEPERSYGCIRTDEQNKDEEQCHGMHSERRIYSAILKERVLDCEHEFHDVDPQKLIWGFSSFGEFVVFTREDLRSELDKEPVWATALTMDIGRLLGWADQHNQVLEQLAQNQQLLAPEVKQECELKLNEYLGYIAQMLDDRELNSAPRIFSINTADRSPWNPKTYFTKKLVLTPFCECERNIHPCEDGRVTFIKDRTWWANTAPWIGRGTKILSVGLQLGFAGMPLTMEQSAFDAIKNDVAFMKELSKYIEIKAGDAEQMEERPIGVAHEGDGDRLPDVRRDDKDARLMQANLSRFLEEVAPNNYRARQWGSLRRIRMSDNSYRWLCEECSIRFRS